MEAEAEAEAKVDIEIGDAHACESRIETRRHRLPLLAPFHSSLPHCNSGSHFISHSNSNSNSTPTPTATATLIPPHPSSPVTPPPLLHTLILIFQRIAPLPGCLLPLQLPLSLPLSHLLLYSLFSILSPLVPILLLSSHPHTHRPPSFTSSAFHRSRRIGPHDSCHSTHVMSYGHVERCMLTIESTLHIRYCT